MDMVERVARALCEAERAGRISRGYPALDVPWSDFIPDARAAIAAMREPSSASVIALIHGVEDNGMASVEFDVSITEQDARKMWAAAIDAALGDTNAA